MTVLSNERKLFVASLRNFPVFERRYRTNGHMIRLCLAEAIMGK